MSEILEEDVAPQEVIAPEQEEQMVPDAEQQPEQKPAQEDVQEKNWRAARMKMEEQTHQIHLLQHELELIRRSQSTKPEEPEEEEYLTDSERRLAQKIKSLEAMVKKGQVDKQDYVIDQLRHKYSDFDDVLSPENIEYLKRNNPALAKAIYSLKEDPYEQGLAAYDALRHTDWYKNRDSMHDKGK